jgi:hypothetical protein
MVLERFSSNYVAFEYEPQMKFNQFLLNFGGLLGLWQGLSLIDLKNNFIKIFNILFSKYHGMSGFFRCFTNSKILKILRTLLMKKVRINFYNSFFLTDFEIYFSETFLNCWHNNTYSPINDSNNRLF